MGVRRESEYKQMAFETAVRNPERYKDILSALKEFDGVILNKENLLTIVSSLYRNGIVTTDKYNIEKLSNPKLNDVVIEVNSTRNSDGGFPKGYCSRFLGKKQSMIKYL